MGRRIDTVLVIGPAVFAIEFKVGEKTFDRSAIDQVWDYGLDLKNFHEASHDVSIVPILVATEATESPPPELRADSDKLCRPIFVDPANFRGAVDLALRTTEGGPARPADLVSRPISSDADDRRSCAFSLCATLRRSHRALRRWRAESARHVRTHRGIS